ncbi:MAG TPA: hypothetical protein VMW87_02575 [Spirochaetia bacterium]|nr:hypothetical protein [Spirochaetia bacterium]
MRRFSVVLVVLAFAVAGPVHAYRLLYKEQLYPLIQYQLNMYPRDWAENIQWLDLALKADFANPLYALAKIDNTDEWEFYRDLFMMHLNLKLVEQYLEWGSEFNKQVAYFYNYPWKQENLDSLNKAEALFKYALNFWTEAKSWSDKAAAARFRWMNLDGVHFWQDESYRIQNGELDYNFIVNRHLTSLEGVRKTFEAMNRSTY